MGWQFWTELLIRSGMVLIACQAVRRFARRLEAAQRYRIGLFAFGLLAVLPLLSALLPGIPIGNWFGPRAVVTVEMGPLVTASAAAAYGSASSINWLLLAWSVGAAIGFGWLAAGRIALWRLTRHAAILPEARRLELVCELSGATGLRREPEILIFDKPVIPVTFGIWHPKILLPVNCAEWTDSRWRVVLLHELAHIKRRDIAAQLFASVTCALWWFQPLAWRARRRLRQDSERVCDAQVILAGMRPSEYAAELLAIARGSQWGLPSCAAIGMASEQLEARLHAILRAEPGATRSRARGFIAILTLIVFATAASAVQLGGSRMKRTILSGLLASASLSAATIGGTVLDPSGAVIPDANIVLINPDNSAQQQAASASDGKFSFDGLTAGQYILRVEKPGFATLFREYTVGADTNVARALVMQMGRVEQDLTIQGKGQAATMQPNEQPIRVGGNVAAANLIAKVAPVYPPDARAAGVQGTVMMEATISKDGTLMSLTVLSSPSDELSQSALDAVRQWRYRPTLLNGQPVEVITDIRLVYQLTQ
jgi:TonB family protein